jgi:DeoR family transcriptional regulator of aga operon/DeoR family fructose operon transcriptional repressor
MKTEARRSQIIQLLEQKGSVLVDDLVAQFEVSHVTIRKDLTELEERSLLRRTHGGATHAYKGLFDPSFREKVNLQQVEKQAIARVALEHIEEGDTLVLGAGSTVLTLARLMKPRFRSLYIITNSIPIAIELVDTHWDILLVGGQVRQHSMALVGPAAVRTLEVYHADKAFIGASGVTLGKGYTTPNPYMSDIIKAMIRAADKVYALVDSSKLGQATLASFASLEEVDLLISDEAAPSAFLQALQQQKCNYRLAVGEATASRTG